MSTMNRIRKTSVAAAPLALLLTFAGTTPVTASPASVAPATGGAACTAQAATTAASADATSMEQVTGARAAELTDAVSSALADGTITTKAPQSALALDDAKVYTVTSQGTEVTSVTVPIGGEYGMLSNLTAVFDADGTLVQSGESLLSENAQGNVNASTFQDGRLVSSNDTDQPFLTDAEMLTADAPASTARAAEGNTVACVATVLGVSGAVAAGIVSLCAGSCTIPVAGTAICVACIGAYATVGGGSIGAVASCF